MLKLDFLESGIGETILITFPDGQRGLVDAHPSSVNSRPAILDLLGDTPLRFICLTHPHKDHGADLIPVLQAGLAPKLWHSVDNVSAFLFQIENVTTFRSAISDACIDILKDWAEFAIKFWDAVDASGTTETLLHSGYRIIEIAGAKISIGAPSTELQCEIRQKYVRRCSQGGKTQIDPNDLSIVMLIEYAGRCILLGADAMKKAWAEVKRIQHADNLPKASVLKVPHHGASNSLHFNTKRPGNVSYLDLCAKNDCIAVLFAGDIDHPHPRVKERLQEATLLKSFTDLSEAAPPIDNLNIGIYGAVPVSSNGRKVRFSQFTVTIQADGVVNFDSVPFSPI